MTNGPMMVGFTVYEDFMTYSSGVYQHVTGGVAGGHAVKLIGWGNDAGGLYWVCQNQWGTTWGNSGYFNIRYDNSGLDAVAWGCEPDLEFI